MSFHIFLPSNVKSVGGQTNKAAKYNTELSEPIELDGDDWWVGLYQLHYPRKIQNIKNCFFHYYSHELKTFIVGVLDAGTYHDIQPLVELMQGQLDSFENDKGVYTVSVIENRVMITITKHANDDPIFRSELTFSPNLSRIFGLPIRITEEGNTIGEPYDLYACQNMFHVETNVIENVNVGSIQSPLLAVVPVDTDKNHQDNIVCYQPQSMSYSRVRGYKIPVVSISIKNRYGDEIDFYSNQSVMTVLHFKKGDEL